MVEFLENTLLIWWVISAVLVTRWFHVISSDRAWDDVTTEYRAHELGKEKVAAFPRPLYSSLF